MSIKATIDSVDYNGVETITTGGKSIALTEVIATEEKSVTITSNGTTEVTKSANKDGMTKVTVVTNVSGGGNLQSKTVTPNAAGQTVSADSGYDGLSSVVVNGDADLVASNIKKNVEIFGVTGSYEGSGGGTDLWQYVKYIAPTGGNTGMFMEAVFPNDMDAVFDLTNVTLKYNGLQYFMSNYRGLNSITVNLGANKPINLSSAFSTNFYRSSCKTLTINGDLSKVQTYDGMLAWVWSGSAPYETINANIDCRSCTEDIVFDTCTTGASGQDKAFYLKNITLVANTVAQNIFFGGSPALTDASIISIANGLRANVSKTITFDNTVKAKLETILGNVSRRAFAITSNTSATVTVNEATFNTAVSSAVGSYTYTFDGTNWKDSGSNVITLADYGITFTGTAANTNTIEVQNCDCFAANASGTTDLETFITTTKGWTIA